MKEVLKKCLVLALVSVFALAQSVKIENVRTELYSKSAANTLKKVEFSLEFEGANLFSNENKLLDSTNTVVASFFYEDLFTELGKMKFKDTLMKFINKKYQLGVKNVYILSLKGVEKFDIKEFKSFLEESTEEKKEEIKRVVNEQNSSISVPKIPPLPDVSTILNDTTGANNANIDDIQIQNIQRLQIPQIPNLPENVAPQPIRLKDSNTTRLEMNGTR